MGQFLTSKALLSSDLSTSIEHKKRAPKHRSALFPSFGSNGSIHLGGRYFNLHAFGAIDVIHRSENSWFAQRQKRPGFGPRGPHDRRFRAGFPSGVGNLLRADKAAHFN